MVDNSAEENAAVLKRLEKNRAFATLAGEDGVADNSAEENAAVLKRLEKNGAFATLAGGEVIRPGVKKNQFPTKIFI